MFIKPGQAISSGVINQVARDVARVRKEARIVFEIGDGLKMAFKHNPDWRLNVVAVVGSGSGLIGTPAQGHFFKEALLLEVGLWRTKPYQQVEHPPRSKEGVGSVSGRRKWFGLNRTQYRLVIPQVSDFLQLHVDLRVAEWKTGKFFWLSTSRRRYFRSKKGFVGDERKREQPRGIRCMVSMIDRELVRDIRLLELADPLVQHSLGSTARLVELILSKHRRGFRDFWNLKASGQVKSVFSRATLTPHLKLEVLRRLSKRDKAQFGHYLLEMIGFPLNTSLDRSVLHERPKHFDVYQVRVVRETDKYLTAEIFSNPPLQQEVIEERAV